LEAIDHSAAIRAGTIHDDEFHLDKLIPYDPPSGMVDPQRKGTLQEDAAEP
jgi:hypothetical protein